jgi:hypothetical protein
VGVEVISATELLLYRQFGVDPGSSQGHEGQFCLWDCLVPQVHEEVVVCRIPPSGQVIPGCSVSSFGCVASVVIWRGHLILDTPFGEV